MTRPPAIVLLLLSAAALHAQSLRILSEFRRVGPNGELVEPDRNGKPREIISPAVARQAFASYRVVVSLPPGTRFDLHYGDNPENLLQPTLYRESAVRAGTQWVPDLLEKVGLPYAGLVPQSASAVTFWLDLYTPSQASVRRVRAELQLNVGDQWIINPLEVRIHGTVVPKASPAPVTLAPVASNAAETSMMQLDSPLCGSPPKAAGAPGAAPSPLTVRHLAFRNAQQDVALLRQAAASNGEEPLVRTLATLLGAPDVKTWCASRAAPAAYDPDVYLKVRDYLVQNAIK